MLTWIYHHVLLFVLATRRGETKDVQDVSAPEVADYETALDTAGG